MSKLRVVQALADCLETLRQGSDLDGALERCPEYRAQLKALLEVVSLIRPLAENVAPSPALREAIRVRLTELQEEPRPSLSWHRRRTIRSQPGLRARQRALNRPPTCAGIEVGTA